MPGANNGASGVALVLELARRIATLEKPDIGVDFVFFDGEEGPRSLGGGDENWRAMGSPHFVDSIHELYAHKEIVTVIVFDMVCYREAVIRPETSSIDHSAAQVEKFWEIGSDGRPKLFSFDPLPYAIDDDHTAFIRARLPAFLVIGFEYEPWYNTTQDTPDKCSAAVLAAVADTALRFVGDIGRQR
jgi:Zn-dependent M28 family amino/carboxypeptidase